MLGSPRTPQAQCSLVPQSIEQVASLVDPDCGVPAERFVVDGELHPSDVTVEAGIPPAPVIVRPPVLSTREPRLHTIIRQTRGEDAAEVNVDFLFTYVKVSLVQSGDCVVLTVISESFIIAVEVVVAEARLHLSPVSSSIRDTSESLITGSDIGSVLAHGVASAHLPGRST